ncbi:MAG: barstar family protein [Nocardioides sp.]
MSPLRSLLDAELVPGVHLWSSALDVAYVRGAVRRAGWGFAHLRGADLATASDFHPAIAAALGFPEYYGRNLDALADCLSDCTGSQVLLWDDWGVLARAEPRLASIVVDLLGSSSVTTLLRGEGPSIPGVDRR